MTYSRMGAGGSASDIINDSAVPGFTVKNALESLLSGGATLISSVTLGAVFLANQAFQLENGIAMPVTSIDVSSPTIDGLTLSAGGLGASVAAACIQGVLYTTTGVPAQEQLWLGQNGVFTGTVPSLVAGDVWMVSIGHRDDATHYTLDPQDPIKL